MDIEIRLLKKEDHLNYIQLMKEFRPIDIEIKKEKLQNCQVHLV